MTTDRTHEPFDVILNDGLIPHVQEMAPILLRGDIAVVLYAPDSRWEKAVRAIGWDGQGSVFALDAVATRTIGTSGPAALAWVQRRVENPAEEGGRVLLIARERSFLVNYRPGAGFDIEPGSTGVGAEQIERTRGPQSIFDRLGEWLASLIAG